MRIIDKIPPIHYSQFLKTAIVAFFRCFHRWISHLLSLRHFWDELNFLRSKSLIHFRFWIKTLFFWEKALSKWRLWRLLQKSHAW